MKQKIVFIVGPTASGKTETAVFLAKKINAEIISCDSMQVYQGMDILTSKPGEALRKKIPHYLIDAVAPGKEYNVSQYRRQALQKIREIVSRGKVPLFVGGTGMYMSVVVDGIFKGGKADDQLRALLYKRAGERGNAYIHEKLKKVDPLAAERIHVNDTKRLIRALEVYMATGKPISELQKQRKGLFDKYDIRMFCLVMERPKLNERIQRRVDKMFSKGLVKEVERLIAMKPGKTALKAIGVQEVKGYLEGKHSLAQAKDIMKRNTCLYAKRQMTWFRKDKRLHWVRVDDKTPGQTAIEIHRWLKE